MAMLQSAAIAYRGLDQTYQSIFEDRVSHEDKDQSLERKTNSHHETHGIISIQLPTAEDVCVI